MLVTIETEYTLLVLQGANALINNLYWLIVLGFKDTSILVGHFMSSPREREKRDRRDSRGDKRVGQGRKRNRIESKEIEEVTTFSLYHYLLQG